jgi:hypothetical protein
MKRPSQHTPCTSALARKTLGLVVVAAITGGCLHLGAAPSSVVGRLSTTGSVQFVNWLNLSVGPESIGGTLWDRAATGSIEVEPVGILLNITAGGSFLAGFLEPDTTYRLHVKVHHQTATFDVSTLPRRHYWADAEKALIQPGSHLSSGCTLAFILRTSTNDTLYALTAGHCVTIDEHYSIVLHDAQGRPSKWINLGYRTRVPADDTLASDDWGLIRIDNESRDLVSPSVMYWGGPSGVAQPARLQQGATVCYIGWGTSDLSTGFATHRCAEINSSQYHENNSTGLQGVAIPGDSGAPSILAESGEAVSIVTAIGGGLPPPQIVGPSLCHIMRVLNEQTPAFRLATAPIVKRDVDPHVKASSLYPLNKQC